MAPLASGPAGVSPAGDCSASDIHGEWLAPSVQVGVAVVLAGVLVALLAGAGGASVPAGALNTTNDTSAGSYNASNDTTAPTVGNLTKVNETVLNLTIEDDGDVDESTIDGADFFVSDGRIDNVTATDTGSNATVEIQLEERLDTDRLGVAVADGASIADPAGNGLNASGDVWRYVEGMDSRAPAIKLYKVGNGSGDTVELTVRASEELADMWVRLYGPADQWVTLDNFRKPSGINEYVTSVEPPATGSYTVTLVNATDRQNNTRESSRSETVAVDVLPPRAVASIDFGASTGRTITFDANRSSDDSGIRNLTWDFGDGSNATSWQPTHTFEPGNYTVTLRVTDTAGHVGTDQLRLNLTDGNLSTALVGDAGDAAAISSPTEDSPSALVQVPRTTAGDPIEIARGSDVPIAETDEVSLDKLSITLTKNDSLSLAVQATSPLAVNDVTDAGAGEPLGGLTVVHDVPDDAIQSVQFSFGVAEDRLAERAAAPADLRLYRYNEGSWTALPTTHLNVSNDSHRYRATAPGLSRFAIAPASAISEEQNTPETESEPDTTPAAATPTATATPTPTPPQQSPGIAVTAASLNRSSIAPGQAVAVNATVQNSMNADGSIRAALTVDGQVAAARNVSISAGGERSISFRYGPNATGEYAVAVNGTDAGTLTVGNSDGGFLGFLPLGLLPLGLLGTLVTYLGGVLAAVFLILKAVALYMDY
jgi:hypothetical protein